MSKMTFAAPVCVLGALWLGTAMRAQQTPAGVISGSVTADRGEVRALRVKARDTLHRMAYVVFTVKGRYQIRNLPPSTYEVQVLEPDFESPMQRVELQAGQSHTADLALTAITPVGIGAGGVASGYGATIRMADGPDVELVEFDTLYPPAPAREVMLKHCFGCHGTGLGWHNRGRRTEAQWRTAVNRMFRPDHGIANVAPGVPLVTEDRVSAAQKESIIAYLTGHFGPKSSPRPRDLRMDRLVRDEAALAEAMYVQWDVPPPAGAPFTNTGDPRAGLHDVHVSPSAPGVIWITGNQSGSIVRVDTRTLDYNGRTTRWRIPHPANINVVPHGVIEEKGRVLWTELAGDRIGELDPRTGTIRAYRLPTEGAGAHTLRADSNGHIWYTNYSASGKIGRLDLATQQVKEYEPVKSFSGYGITVDRQDRVWAVGLNEPAILGYDPQTDRWTSYPISNPGRRPAVDGKGQVWAAQFFGNRVAMLDPASGEVTEYELPLKFGNPYELIADSQDNIWIENGAYRSLVKLDPRTKRFTYVPYPEIRGNTVKFERDAEDTIWFIMPYGGNQPSGLTAFKPNGNRAR